MQYVHMQYRHRSVISVAAVAVACVTRGAAACTTCDAELQTIIAGQWLDLSWRLALPFVAGAVVFILLDRID